MPVEATSVTRSRITSEADYPTDYVERVYAGVLGKLIGVYLGRPIEGWTYDQITERFGEVDYYLPGRDGAPLVVTDDDVTGTFTFLRALPDHGNSLELTPRQIGETWLNYVIERRTIFWWGGFGNSTEHTAYLRLKHGVPAPKSGSIALNTQVVAEQIGSQIFIDGWAMVAPGDPELAVDLARRAASVSHDGEAIYGAQMLAAMEAQAFVESDVNSLLNTGLGLIPPDSVIARLVYNVRNWHAKEPDWRNTRELIARDYGYDTYSGNCHMVPNHALIILGLLYGNDDFGRSLMIVNTAGWDTDCNSGNLGCLLGIKNGLETFEGEKDWRGPVGDRMYLPTAEGGRAITDAVTETYHIVNASRALHGFEPIHLKDGARFNFSLPGSLQGFTSEDATLVSAPLPGSATQLGLALTLDERGPASATTPTFKPVEALNMPGYELLASPTLHPGQTLRAHVIADPANKIRTDVRLMTQRYNGDDQVETQWSEAVSLDPGTDTELTWTVAGRGSEPIHSVGLEVERPGDSTSTVYLDWLTWEGVPDATFDRPEGSGVQWQRAWINGVDQFEGRWPEPFRVVKNEGTGLIMQGSRDWTDYQIEASGYVHLAKSAGIAARVQGLRRYYALLLCDDSTISLVKVSDSDTSVLAEQQLRWEPRQTYQLQLEVAGAMIRARLDSVDIFKVTDDDSPFLDGGIGLVVEEGTFSAHEVTIRPLGQ